MAEALAGVGSDVVIWGTNAGKNAAACQTLEVHSGRVIVAQVDVSNEAALTAGIGGAVRRFGRLDVVAANAANVGIGRRSASFADISTEDWHTVMAVNLNGVFLDLTSGLSAHGRALGTRRPWRVAPRRFLHLGDPRRANEPSLRREQGCSAVAHSTNRRGIRPPRHSRECRSAGFQQHQPAQRLRLPKGGRAPSVSRAIRWLRHRVRSVW